ncbi:MAG: amidase [Acidimicrobiaceae bacterium]
MAGSADRVTTDPFRWLDATAQADLVRRGEASPVELVEAAIARIERLDPALNAVIHHRFERALEEAAAGPPDGPFRGVPFLLKDLFTDSEGDPAHNGMKALRDAGNVGQADAWLVTRHRKAGFVIAGRTNTPEMGLLPTTEPLAHGPTHNPWDTAYSPGGSSGGSGAAVAAGLVPVAHATDGGGSIRIPSSMCGCVGLKVSRGRITMGPDRDESGVSVGHVISRSVRDSAGVLDATHGPGPGDMVIAPAPARPYVEEVGADPGQLRVGMLASNPQGPLHPDCDTAVRGAAKLLESLGHHVEEAHPAALDGTEMATQFAARWCANAAFGLVAAGTVVGRTLGAEDVEPITWALAEFGRTFSAVDLAGALAASARFTRSIGLWFADGWDLLLTPTLSQPPPRLGEIGAGADNPLEALAKAGPYAAFTSSFNVTGQPAISLPLHWNDAGLPIGVQLVAAYAREDVLLRVAGQLEQAAPWSDRRPLVS